MVAKTFSATLLGLEAIKIEVEVDGRRGVPGLEIIGLPNRAVTEARERVTAALQNLGIRIKSLKTIINLAPADLRKDAPHLELAMALGLLSLYGQIKQDLTYTLLLGELSLDGSLKPVRGIIPLVQAAQRLGFTQIIVPSSNQTELSYIKGVKMYHASHLQQVIAWAQQYRQLPTVTYQLSPATSIIDNGIFDHIQGQELAKRALLIAAVGKHHVLMTGPPGVGKTLLAQTLPSLLPPLTPDQQTEVLAIHSLNQTTLMSESRPFRSPHQTVSLTNLIGGGPRLFPGEITLAHQGVLFLDELAEFPRSHLEALRQPLENKTITFLKQGRSISYPCDFQLIAATNPCRCGYAGSSYKTCTCSVRDRHRYQQRLSGPILDRIDLHLFLEEPTLGENTSDPGRLSLRQAQEKVARALAFRQQRSASIASAAQKILDQAAHQLHISARSYAKTLSIARTIANLDQSTSIQAQHMAEALQYRSSH